MIESAPSPRHATAPRKAPALDKTLHVLLAEDDEEMRAVLRFALTRRGYEVAECADGMDLAEHISAAVLLEEEPLFDLLITDLRLPGVSGLSLLEVLHEMPGAPPAILITAFGDAATHERAAALGVARVFDKPFELDDLLATVDALLLEGDAGPADGGDPAPGQPFPDGPVD